MPIDQISETYDESLWALVMGIFAHIAIQRDLVERGEGFSPEYSYRSDTGTGKIDVVNLTTSGFWEIKSLANRAGWLLDMKQRYRDQASWDILTALRPGSGVFGQIDNLPFGIQLVYTNPEPGYIAYEMTWKGRLPQQQEVLEGIALLRAQLANARVRKAAEVSARSKANLGTALDILDAAAIGARAICMFFCTVPVPA
jgi:hypothetical protein